MSRLQDDEDVFALDKGDAGAKIIPTPYDLLGISQVVEKSNILPQCLNAMVTNVASHGFRIVPIREGVRPQKQEEEMLQSFIESANTEETLEAVQSKVVYNYEKYGFGFYEVIRNRKGQPSLLRAAKSSNIRLTRKQSEAVEVTTVVYRNNRRSTVREMKRFRRYVQQNGNVTTYFKEFGDPRRMSYTTGQYDGDDYKVPKGEEATELLHRRQYSEDPYGLPRWISQLPSILGSREAEEVNLRYFEDNTVPPMIMTVAGGRLTRSSFIELKSLLERQGVGRERQNKILLLEAVPEVTDLEGKGSVQLKIEKLTDQRPSDGLFKEYDDANMAKVRSAFRLPPVVLGMSQDVTFATANVSAYLAETQVFQPERGAHDEFLNMRFVNHPLGLNLKTVKLESRGPAITNPEEVVKSMTALNVMGAVTPRSAIDIANESLLLSLPQYPEKGQEGYEEWMDLPMSIGQRLVMNKTQQTGEGDNTHDGQSGKDQDIKDREKEGEVAPEGVENGQQ
jgi:PBSX family phage portal protein